MPDQVVKVSVHKLLALTCMTVKTDNGLNGKAKERWIQQTVHFCLL